jgi:predicted ATP-grasp superfamily ATP-dependent carboligase
MAEEHLLIIGASVRAAAFSALRAGLRPWCVDLFGDADLRAVCPAHRLTGQYPQGFEEWFDRAPPGPWMYTGGLENWPGLIGRWAQRRPLWGNGPEALRRARDPSFVAALMREGGGVAPEVRRHGEPLPDSGEWLVKPLRGSGGAGIRVFDGVHGPGPTDYLQQYLSKTSCSLVFVADGQSARLLGFTFQMVGEPCLHAPPFRYCGSVAFPLVVASFRQQLERLGASIARGCALHGLFGVDCLWRYDVDVDGEPQPQLWPVEVNPRYPASVEVVEHTFGLRALEWHRWACTPSSFPDLPDLERLEPMVGKAILFARREVIFPAEGPWSGAPLLEGSIPAFADIPDPGERIEADRPILSFFATTHSQFPRDPDQAFPTSLRCYGDLCRTAADLDRLLFGA